MFLSRFASTLALTLAMGSAVAGPIHTLYDGVGDPTSQGWTVFGSGTQTVLGGTTEFKTSNEANNLTSQFDWFKYDTGATDYIAALRLKVISSSYNNLDAALTFNPFGNNVLATYARANTFMIGNGIVLWGDETGGSVSLDTSAFHDYEMRYHDGQLSLYIDASFDDIASGNAIAALSRSVTAPTGYLVWGDATNDPNFNSDYIVDELRFQNLQEPFDTSVPEPSTIALMALGFGGLLIRRRVRAD